MDAGDGRLGVQRVEDRFEQQQIDAAVDQPADLFAIRLAHLGERRGAERRVVDVRRDRERAVGRADGAGDEARLRRRPAGPRIGRFAREPRRLDVQLVDERLEPEIGLRDRRAAERVGLDDVGAGLQIGVVDRRDQIGAREDEQVDVVLDEMRRDRGSASPRTAASSSLCCWTIVPIAPSSRRMRPARARSSERSVATCCVQASRQFGNGQ